MKKIVSTDKAPAAIGPYSQAIQFSGLLYVSGQIGIDPQTGEFVDDTIEGQTEQVLENLKAIIEEAGMTLMDVLKCSCFLKSMDNFITFNSIYEKYFGANPPARETIAVAGLPKDALVEVSAICGVE
ncbi:MAG: RidA family protein [Desulfobacterales bacterium]|jgi:2-iminobutanoate/2-iminopropanoate deaminase